MNDKSKANFGQQFTGEKLKKLGKEELLQSLLTLDQKKKKTGRNKKAIAA